MAILAQTAESDQTPGFPGASLHVIRDWYFENSTRFTARPVLLNTALAFS